MALDGANFPPQAVAGGTGAFATPGLFIHSNDDVGMGTTSPESRLHVVSPDNVIMHLEKSGGGYAGLWLEAANGNGYEASVLPNGDIYWYGWDGTGGHYIEVMRYMESTGGHLSLAPPVASPNNINNVGIGTDSPTQKLHVVGNILASGTITPSSDARLKKNVTTVEDGLNKVMALNPVGYDKKHTIDGDFDETAAYEYGFLAQEVQEVLPKIVKAANDEHGTLSLNYNAIVPVLTKAIQAQQAEIEALKAQNEVLSAQSAEIETLKAQNEVLSVQTAEIETLKAQNEALLAQSLEFEQLKTEFASIKAMLYNETKPSVSTDDK